MPRRRRARVTFQTPSSVQTLLFARAHGWTPDAARAWARRHGYRYGSVDLTRAYVRLRQYDPPTNDQSQFATIEFGDFDETGIKAVIQSEHIPGNELARELEEALSDLDF